MKIQNKNAFTLVELIVVITILAILGTIAFISLQGYSADARNSRRISDISNIKTSLELFTLNTGKYPFADNPQNMTYSGGTLILWKQGTIGDVVTTNLSRNLNKKPTDPLYETEYIYSTLENGSKYEVMAVYEGELLSQNNNKLLNNTYADNSNTVKINGTYNGLYIKKGNYIVPSPSIITSEELPLDFDITTISSQVIDGGTNIPNIGTTQITNSTGGLSFPTFEVYNGALTSNSSTGELLDTYNALANTYSGSSIENIGIINSLLTQASDEEKISFTETVVLNTTSDIVTNTDTETSIETEPALITQNECENEAGWIWVADDVYIGSTQGDGFCISPRFGDWGDSNDWDDGISFNGWGNYPVTRIQGWDASSIDDYDYVTYSLGNPSPEFGQTRTLDSSTGYTCIALNSGSSNVDETYGDTIIGRMKWLTMTGNNYNQAQNIDWITGATPPSGHAIPALYIADCIDGVKDLGTDMEYKHYPDEGLNETITYTQYNNEVTTLNTDIAYLSDTTYQNRQKYLTAWTQKSGSHLPSAFSYITNGKASANDDDGDLLIGNDRGEYQVACEADKFGVVTWDGTQYTGSEDYNYEWIRLSAIGHPNGSNWGTRVRILGNNGCGQQGNVHTGRRGNDFSARFIVRP